MIEVTEGARFEGVYVLTAAELERIVRRETAPMRRELLRLRQRETDLSANNQLLRRALRDKGVAEIPPPLTVDDRLERRRKQWRDSGKRRYRAYKELCDRLGVKTTGDWCVQYRALLEQEAQQVAA